MQKLSKPLDEKTKAYYRAEIRQGLLDIAIKLGEGVARNGNPYHWMIDCRELLLTGPYLHYVSQLLWNRLKNYQPDAVGGLTLAANPLTIGLMYESRAEGIELEGLIIRREPKNNGLQKQVEGPPVQQDWRIVLLDDLVNSGDTQRAALAALRPFDCEPVAVGVIIDYERQGSEWLLERGIGLEALFTLSELGISETKASQPGLFEFRWSCPLNRGEYSAPKSTPVIQEQVLYVGSDTGVFTALSLDGKEIWSYKVRDTERGIHSTPLLSEGRVVFGSYDGYLTCLDSQTSELIWETRLGQWIGSSPVYSANKKIIFIGIEYGESGGSLIAVESDKGNTLWELPTQDYVHSTPCFDPLTNRVMVGANDGVLRCADAESGKLVWSFQTGGEIKAQATTDTDGLCFFGSFDGFLYAVSTCDGQLIWKKKLSATLYYTPIIYQDLVIAGGTSERLVALERKTGRVRWIRAHRGTLVGGAAIDGDHQALIVGGHRGDIAAISLISGETLWTHKIDHPFRGTPLYHNGCIYLASLGDLICLGSA